MNKSRPEERIWNLENYDELNYLKYSNLMAKVNDDLWRKKEKYLYNSYKNENYILPTIAAFPFCCLFGGLGILHFIAILIYVFYLCCKNDMALSKDPRVIESRISTRNYRRVYMNMNV